VSPLSSTVIGEQIEIAQRALEAEGFDTPIVSFEDIRDFLIATREIPHADIPLLIGKYTNSPVGMVNLLSNIRSRSTDKGFKSRLTRMNSNIKKYHELTNDDRSADLYSDSFGDFDVTL